MERASVSLTLAISVRDVANVLGVDLSTAIEVKILLTYILKELLSI